MGKKHKLGLEDLGGLIYSTNPEASFEANEDAEEQRPADKQNLYLSRDKKNRKGKVVTLIEGFEGSDEEAKALTKNLKQLCGSGGAWKDEEIVVQGDFRDKIFQFLIQKGYKVTEKGG